MIWHGQSFEVKHISWANQQTRGINCKDGTETPNDKMMVILMFFLNGLVEGKIETGKPHTEWENLWSFRLKKNLKTNPLTVLPHLFSRFPPLRSCAILELSSPELKQKFGTVEV